MDRLFSHSDKDYDEGLRNVSAVINTFFLIMMSVVLICLLFLSDIIIF
jgi:hypothetical protein